MTRLSRAKIANDNHSLTESFHSSLHGFRQALWVGVLALGAGTMSAEAMQQGVAGSVGSGGQTSTGSSQPGSNEYLLEIQRQKAEFVRDFNARLQANRAMNAKNVTEDTRRKFGILDHIATRHLETEQAFQQWTISGQARFSREFDLTVQQATNSFDQAQRDLNQEAARFSAQIDADVAKRIAEGEKQLKVAMAAAAIVATGGAATPAVAPMVIDTVSKKSSPKAKSEALQVAPSGQRPTNSHTTSPGFDPGDWHEQETLENQRLVNGFLPDGARGVSTGNQYVPVENIGKSILLVPGILTTPEEAQRMAEETARVTNRPVIPFINQTQSKVLGDSAAGVMREGAGIIGGTGSELANTLEHAAKSTGEAVGSVVDMGQATWDRFAPSSAASEAATKSLASDIIKRLDSGGLVDIVSHSEGTVITANALRLVDETLRTRIEHGELKPEERRELLSRVHVVAAGSYAHPSSYVPDVQLSPVNNGDDFISLLGGWTPMFGPDGVDTSLNSHRYSEGYLNRVGKLLGSPPKEQNASPSGQTGN